MIVLQTFQMCCRDAGNVKRRFYINNLFAGCAGDVGWLVVKDIEEDVCMWAKVPPYTAILYSPTSSKIIWDSPRVSRADVLAIWVKLK